MFQNEAFLISLKNIVLWSLIAGTLHVGFGVLVAFVLYHKPKGCKFTRTVFDDSRRNFRSSMGYDL